MRTTTQNSTGRAEGGRAHRDATAVIAAFIRELAAMPTPAGRPPAH